MKNLFYIPFIFCMVTNAQTIKYDTNFKLPDNLVVETAGTQSSLYNKSLDWIKKFYKNPDRVITAKTEDKLIKFNGACVGCLKMKLLGTPYTNTLRYIITLEFKDNKYKFEISSVTFENADDLKDGNALMIKKNGKIKSSFKDYPETIENELNHVFESLKEYVVAKNNDNW